MSSSKQIKWGIVLTYLQMFIGIAISIFYTSLTIRMLGSSEYGIYTLASSIISYLNLFSLGFGASYIKFYSKYKANNDEEGIKKLNGLFFVVFFILGGLALVTGVGLICNVGVMFNSTYSLADLKLARILMIFLTINLTISFPMSVFVSYITSQEKFIFQKLVNMGKTILSPTISIFLLFMGYGSIGMVVATTIVSLGVDVVNMVFCFTKLKFRAKFGKVDYSLLKEIFMFSLFIAINMLIDQLNAQTDKVILGKMINASAVAIYAVADQIRNMYVMLSTSISGVFAPTVHRIVNENEDNSNQQLTDLFIRIGRIQFFILMLVLSGFIFFGQKFIDLWVGSEFSLAYWLVLILIVPGTVPLIQNIGIEVQRAKNKHQFRSLVYLIIAITNVIISIILCKFYGIVGVTIGTAISNILGQIIIMNIYYHRVIGLNIISFWKNILKASMGMIIPIILGVMFMIFVPFNNIFIYFGAIAIYGLVYLISLYFIGFNKEEKSFVNKGINKILKKKV